jgi:hypothetical protein
MSVRHMETERGRISIAETCQSWFEGAQLFVRLAIERCRKGTLHGCAQAARLKANVRPPQTSHSRARCRNRSGSSGATNAVARHPDSNYRMSKGLSISECSADNTVSRKIGP